MPNSTEESDRLNVKARLKELLQEMSTLVDHATEEQQFRLLRSLEDLRARERRGHPRKPCAVRVTFATQDLLLRDTARNISSGGVFIETSAPLSVGQKITLWFSTPLGEELIKMKGEIVWTPQKGIGVKFTSPLGRDLEQIIEAL